MTIDQMKRQHLLLFECVSGSHMYGLNIATSDRDIRGVFRYPAKELIRLFDLPAEISGNNEDTKYYELRKFMSLLLTCNPTVLEFLWCPEDCILQTSRVWDRLVESRQLFVTSKAYWSHTGYAYAQIKKARGKNKKVNRSADYDDPDGILLLQEWLRCGYVTEDWIGSRFCKPLAQHVVRQVPDPSGCSGSFSEMDERLERGSDRLRRNAHGNIVLRGPDMMEFVYLFDFPDKVYGSMPFRPAQASGDFRVQQAMCQAAAVEHVPNMYRLYRYGPDCNGVFHDGQVVCQSIPLADELKFYVGLMYFNQAEYERARNEYKSYWEWRLNRNDARWTDQENGTLNFDQKNMTHTVRLLLSGMHILTHGEPLVRFGSEDHEFLMGIRQGRYTYEYLLGLAEQKIAEMEALYRNTSLPCSPDTAKIAGLYEELAWMEN